MVSAMRISGSIPTLETDLDGYFDQVEQMLTEAHNLTGWFNVQQNYGFTGLGQTVAVIDSGIAWDHFALGGGFGAGYRVVGGWDFTEENDANPYDDGALGLARHARLGHHRQQRIGRDTGVAPGVDLVGLRVFNDAGQGFFSWIENALRWVHNNRNSVRESDHGGQPVARRVELERGDDSRLGQPRRRVRPARGRRHLHRRVGRQQLREATTRRA